MNKEKKNNRIFLLLGLGLLLLALILGVLFYLYTYTDLFSFGKFGVVNEEDLVETDFENVPHDALFVTQDRKAYKDGTMRLVVPRLDLDTTVGGDTIPSALIKKPGLYEFSQMPSQRDVNVSIAGHRDIGHQEFYYQDTIGIDDRMYLIYEGTVFQYLFHSTRIVPDDDWDVIKRQGFSALTLTTCDPIGTTLNRLITVGVLEDVYPYSSDVEFNQRDAGPTPDPEV